MTRRHVIAIAVGLAAMLLALVPPLWIRATGDEVALSLEPVDPLSLFRGNYVDLRYDVDIAVPPEADWGEGVFVVFDDSRPANPVRVTTDKPSLEPGETCVLGRAYSEVEFPTLEQYFVTPEEGSRLEGQLGNLVGVLKTTGSCRAVLVSLEPI